MTNYGAELLSTLEVVLFLRFYFLPISSVLWNTCYRGNMKFILCCLFVQKEDEPVAKKKKTEGSTEIGML